MPKKKTKKTARKKMKLPELTQGALVRFFGGAKSSEAEKIAFIRRAYTRGFLRRGIKKHRLSKPEEMFFGFLVIISIFFGAYCFASVKQIPENLPSAIYPKSTSVTKKNIDKMVQGYPIKKMAYFIGRQNNDVAAYLVAIAKKESNWGKFSPKDDGQECYNYWGYRGPENPTASGYSCFSSPKQAVDVVGRRIKNLIAEKIDTPQEMVMWKCGPGCSRRESYSARKWVRDVGFYYNQLYPEKVSLSDKLSYNN